MGSQASKRDREMKKKGGRHASHHKRSTWQRAEQWRIDKLKQYDKITQREEEKDV